MKYTWDKKLMWNLWKNPNIRREMASFYSAYINPFNFINEVHLSKKDTLENDTVFLLENPFLEKILYNFAYKSNLKDIPEGVIKEKLTKEDLLDLTNCFYSSIDKDIYSYFEPIFKERFSHFWFNPSFLSKMFDGFTYHSEIANDTFISVNNFGNVVTLFAIIHEYAHALWWNGRNSDCLDFEDSVFDETEAIFMELIAADFFTKKCPNLSNDIQIANFDSYNTSLTDMDIIMYKNDFKNKIVDLDISLRDLNAHSLMKIFKKEMGLTKGDIHKIFAMPAHVLCPYPIGTLTAIELYLIYEKDPEKGLDLYKKIMNLKAQDNQDYYEQIKKMGISPSENIDIYERKLMKS